MHVGASEGEIGHVEDFLVGDVDWTVRHIEVDTPHGWSGRTELVPPSLVQRVDWADRAVLVGVDRQGVRTAPGYDNHELAQLGR